MFVSSANRVDVQIWFIEPGRSLIYKRKNNVPSIDPAQVAGFLVVILNDYSDWEENVDTELCNTHHRCFVKSS